MMHPFTAGLFGFSTVLRMTSKASLSAGVQSLSWMSVFSSFGYTKGCNFFFQRDVISWLKGKTMFTFTTALHTAGQIGWSFCVPISKTGEFMLPHGSSCVFLVHLSHSSRFWVESSWCHEDSLMTWVMGHIILCSLVSLPCGYLQGRYNLWCSDSSCWWVSGASPISPLALALLFEDTTF